MVRPWDELDILGSHWGNSSTPLNSHKPVCSLSFASTVQSKRNNDYKVLLMFLLGLKLVKLDTSTTRLSWTSIRPGPSQIRTLNRWFGLFGWPQHQQEGDQHPCRRRWRRISAKAPLPPLQRQGCKRHLQEPAPTLRLGLEMGANVR